MNRTTIFAVTAAVSAAALTASGEASACGGCFHPPTQTVSDITDERMLLATSTTQSTLYDQIQYSGSPSSFAWVLPIQGTVSVGLSADVLFDSIDTLTATQIVPPESTCPRPCILAPTAAGGYAATADASAAAAETVTVTKQENVGPYATVQLHSTDGSALNDWLTQNGYQVPSDVAPVITEYVNEGFDFLAMKLLPDQGVQAMRPVRITTPGSNLSLPLRMAAVGTGDTVGITIWVVSDGRYEPQNFPFFHIDDSALVWDWSQSLSNYTTLRAQDEAALDNGGWEIESSITLNQQTITNLILSGGHYLTFGGSPVVSSTSAAPADTDYLPIGNPDAGPDAGETADQVRDDDITALFVGLSVPNVRVTRIRSDIAHSAMTKDFVLQASTDQSELSNVRTVSQSINEICPSQPSCTGASGTTDASTTGTSSGSASGVAASGVTATSGANSSSGSSGNPGTGSGTSSGVGSTGSGGALGPDAGSPPGAAPGGRSSGSWECGASAASLGSAPAAAGALAATLALAFGRVARRRRRAVADKNAREN